MNTLRENIKLDILDEVKSDARKLVYEKIKKIKDEINSKPVDNSIDEVREELKVLKSQLNRFISQNELKDKKTNELNAQVLKNVGDISSLYGEVKLKSD